jgi:hypothetical protein
LAPGGTLAKKHDAPGGAILQWGMEIRTGGMSPERSGTDHGLTAKTRMLKEAGYAKARLPDAPERPLH